VDRLHTQVVDLGLDPDLDLGPDPDLEPMCPEQEHRLGQPCSLAEAHVCP